jgi:hypothetical protein
VQTSVAAHAVLVPHRQAPDASQVSAFAPHATQALPSAPHWAVERVVTQPVGEQHPDEQFTASQMQAPARQYCPLGHAAPLPHRHVPATHASAVIPHDTQARPMVLHEENAGVMQLPAAEQQPAGHEVASQTQVTPTQR